MQNSESYLITGASGAVGSALVRRLLDNSDAEINLVLRAENEAHLTSRLEKLFRFWQLAESDPRRGRITAMPGDVSQPHFGVDDARLRSRMAECSRIIHAAGDVHMGRSIEDARATSVGSVRHLLTLMRTGLEAGVLKKVEVVSTVGVGGRTLEVPERWITEPREYHNTYEQAKAEAEELLSEQIHAHKLPVTVHRPSMVVGDSVTGEALHYQIFYFICEFLSGRHTGGFVPKIRAAKLDVIPSDFVAKALEWSSLTQATSGRIFHESSGPAGAVDIEGLRRLVERLWREASVPLPTTRLVPLGVFKAAIPLLAAVAPKARRRRVRSLSVYLEYALESQAFINERSVADLSTAGIEHPSAESYLEIVLRRYIGDTP